MRARLLAVAVSWCVASCGPPESAPSPQGCALRGSLTAASTASRVVAIGTNYLSGTAWSVDGTGAARALPLGATGDTVVRPLGGVTAVLNRMPGVADNVTLLEPRDGALALVCQVPLVRASERSINTWANPHDVLALDDRTLLVARYNLPSLAVVDVPSGAVVRTVDLAAYRGRAALPNPDAMLRVGDRIYVTLQRLDDVLHPQRGMLVQIDAATMAVTATLELPFANPTGALQRAVDGTTLLAMFGWYDTVGDGGVVALDLRGATPSVASVVLREDDPAVLGNVDGVAVVDGATLVLKVPAERTAGMNIAETRFVRYDLASHRSTVLLRRGIWTGAVPVVLGGMVFIGDPGEGPGHAGAGVRRFTAAGDALPGVAAVGVEMFPYDLRAAP